MYVNIQQPPTPLKVDLVILIIGIEKSKQTELSVFTFPSPWKYLLLNLFHCCSLQRNFKSKEQILSNKNGSGVDYRIHFAIKQINTILVF